MVSAIAAASDQQSSESEKIAASVDAISKVTNESAIGIQQIATTSEDLNRLTLSLQDLVGQFRLEGEAQESKRAAKQRSNQSRVATGMKTLASERR